MSLTGAGDKAHSIRAFFYARLRGGIRAHERSQGGIMTRQHLFFIFGELNINLPLASGSASFRACEVRPCEPGSIV